MLAKYSTAKHIAAAHQSSLLKISYLTPEKAEKIKKAAKNSISKLSSQLGYQRHLHQLLPPDQVNEIVVHEIPGEVIERVGIKATGEFEIIQHIDFHNRQSM